MQADSNNHFQPAPDDSGRPTPPVAPLAHGLPTVTPPSGKMILRLFLVPAFIVGGLVLTLMVAQPLLSWASRHLLGRAWGDSRTPEQFLRELDNSNEEVRWRAASDLAQVLLRDDRLASDGPFALQLADRLQKAIASSAEPEKSFATRLPSLKPEEVAPEQKKLDLGRHYIVYLSACLGNFMVPVGAPLLKELALQESGLEPRALAERRRQAVWALANLGENLKRFDRLPSEQQDNVLARLEETARRDDPGGRARLAHDYLTKRRDGHADALGVDGVLEKCADADDPSLRAMAAFAMNFWSGTGTEDARMEQTLVRLSHDSGKGEDELTKVLEGNPEKRGVMEQLFGTGEEGTRSLIKKPGFRVQSNATIALARRGSPQVRLGLLDTMLDEEQLRGIFVLQSKQSGKEQPDEALVAETLKNALKAVAELHRKRPEFDLAKLKPAVDRLADSPNPAVRAEAHQTQLVLGGQ
jgi:hypothetical protein